MRCYFCDCPRSTLWPILFNFQRRGNLQKDWALLLQAEANDDLTGIESLCAALLHNKFLDQEKFDKILTLIASHKDSFENYGIIKESAFNKKKQMERAYPY